MPILVECICGAKYEAPKELGGGRVDCEKCKRELRVPTAEWDAKYRKELARFASQHEVERVNALKAIRALGTPSIMPALIRAVYDPSRAVVNQSLAAMLSAGEWSRAHLLEYMATGALRPARLVAMVREEQYWEAAPILCDLIDAGKFNENQISEMISLLGEARNERCISTLKALRHAYPNLAMLIDNALAPYKKLDSQVNRIPETATRLDDSSDAKVQEMAASQRTTQKKGCMGMVLLVVLPLGGLGVYAGVKAVEVLTRTGM